MHPLVSVVVLNWNGKHFLGPCLDSLRTQTFQPMEIVVVDNGSTDGSQQFVEANYPEVRLIRLPKNMGFSRGINAGITVARGELLFLLNNDTVVEPGAIDALHQMMCEHSEVGFCATKMVFMDRPHVINAAGDCLFANGLPMNIGLGEEDGPAFKAPRYVFSACAGAAMYRRSMLEEIGFFDEDFFMGYEDVDLAFRAQLAGYKGLFVPKALVRHLYSGTNRVGSRTNIFYSAKNSIHLLVKNMPVQLLLHYFGLIARKEAQCIYEGLWNGTFGIVVHARVRSVLELPLMLPKRAAIQRRRKLTTAQVRALLSIPPEYWKSPWPEIYVAADTRSNSPAPEEPKTDVPNSPDSPRSCPQVMSPREAVLKQNSAVIITAGSQGTVQSALSRLTEQIDMKGVTLAVLTRSGHLSYDLDGSIPVVAIGRSPSPIALASDLGCFLRKVRVAKPQTAVLLMNPQGLASAAGLLSLSVLALSGARTKLLCRTSGDPYRLRYVGRRLIERLFSFGTWRGLLHRSAQPLRNRAERGSHLCRHIAARLQNPSAAWAALRDRLKAGWVRRFLVLGSAAVLLGVICIITATDAVGALCRWGASPRNDSELNRQTSRVSDKPDTVSRRVL